jgi:hypothetical protein
MTFESGKNRDERIDKFLDAGGSYFSHQNFIPVGVFSTLGGIKDNLTELNNSLKASNDSSDKLTRALNRITLAGVVIAGAGVIIALANLYLDYKQTLIS